MVVVVVRDEYPLELQPGGSEALSNRGVLRWIHHGAGRRAGHGEKPGVVVGQQRNGFDSHAPAVSAKDAHVKTIAAQAAVGWAGLGAHRRAQILRDAA